MPLRVGVVGSVNLDLVARCERLPRPGETITDATFQRVPGGKGANQAVAAARLGAEVAFIGCIGNDDFGQEAIAGLEEAGVDLGGLRVVDAPTGIETIIVAADGENQIVVAPGANALLRAEDVRLPPVDLVLCQLEIPVEAVLAAARHRFTESFCLNAAPARPVPTEVLARADLVVVNRHELEALDAQPPADVAVTLGPEGAVLLRGGREVARARPPAVDAVDGTAAGDAFCSSLAADLAARVSEQEALERACAAGALAASRPGAQPSLPTAAEVAAILAR